jgi:formylmethanofuran dehydrogenase subunit E
MTINGAIKQSLVHIRSQAEIFYNSDGVFSYDGVCEDPVVRDLISAAASSSCSNPLIQINADQQPGNIVCNDAYEQWAISAPLNVSSGDSELVVRLELLKCY